MTKVEDKTTADASDPSEFILDSGRSIHLIALHQTRAYEGLLEGVPTDRMNDGILRGVLESAKEITYSRKAHLIIPTRTPIEMGREYAWGRPEALPGIKCIGLFKSYGTISGEGGHSEIALVWFQHCFALPIEPETLKQLLALDWSRIAYDITFDEY